MNRNIKDYKCNDCRHTFREPEGITICPYCQSTEIEKIDFKKNWKDSSTYIFVYLILQVIAGIILTLISYNLGHHNYGLLFAVVSVISLGMLIPSYHSIPKKIFVIPFEDAKNRKNISK